MKRTFAALAIWASCGALAAQAGDGRPSQEKLDNMGLASMKMADDQAGASVRGGQFIHVIWTLRQEAGSMMNSDSDSVTLGRPLNFQPTTPTFVDIVQDPPPVMDTIVGPTSITEITSDTGFRVIAGSAVDAAPSLPAGYSLGARPLIGFRSFRH